MFTGIIESQGQLSAIEKEGSTIHFWFDSPIGQELKIDQSLAHNGVCLTVVELEKNKHKVSAIHETLIRTNLGLLKVGDWVNLERCMPANGRFDGHIVQGHVDETATCISVTDRDGSWEFVFEIPDGNQNLMVPKGSICINGVSLTLVRVEEKRFSVEIIPYTFEHTSFKHTLPGTLVNIEYDVLGKYIQKQLQYLKN
ncbi:MAG: riboflavin synthase [Bacteroidetes bacterium]|nr:riboflavin synthase [Bacteroidota bacterium]